jgi:D-cysteine desulfhydrase
LLLDSLVGADVRFVTPAEYADRDRVLAAIADELRSAGRRPYVIPEGGSNGLGALGYVDAMAEVRAQLDAPDLAERAPRHFEAVAHACGSAGTAAGIGIGALLHDVASEALVFAVCDDRAYFEDRIAQIQRDAFALLAESDRASAPLRVFDEWKGPAYGVPSAEQVLFIRDVARVSGLILDPVYSGKALFGVARMTNKPKNILFIHTGGLPGLLAEPEVFARRS